MSPARPVARNSLDQGEIQKPPPGNQTMSSVNAAEEAIPTEEGHRRNSRTRRNSMIRVVRIASEPILDQAGECGAS